MLIICKICAICKIFNLAAPQACSLYTTMGSMPVHQLLVLWPIMWMYCGQQMTSTKFRYQSRYRLGVVYTKKSGSSQFFPTFPVFFVFPVFREKVPEHRDCQSHGGAHMVPRHCSTEFQSVWSVRGTVALVSNFLRRIADFGSHLFFTSVSSGRRDWRLRIGPVPGTGSL
jgi:hypothetical protein